MVSLDDIDIVDVFAAIAIGAALIGIYDVYINQVPVPQSIIVLLSIITTGGYGIYRFSGDRAGFNITGGVRLVLIILLLNYLMLSVLQKGL